MQSLSVVLGERSYQIHIGSGLLDDARLYAPHVKGTGVAVITNPVVAPLYLDRVQGALARAGAQSFPSFDRGRRAGEKLGRAR